MNKTTKFIILLFTLFIPVAIFLFLKMFGENRFDVEVYYQNGVDTVAMDCDNFSKAQHVVPHFLVRSADGTVQTDELLTQGLSVVSFIDLPLDEAYLKSLSYQFDKIENVIPKDRGFNIITFVPSGYDRGGKKLLEQVIEPNEKRGLLYGAANAIGELGKCGFVLNTTANDFQGRMVLVDDEKRIRGYYDVNDAEEVDRLLLEMKILFRNRDEYGN